MSAGLLFTSHLIDDLRDASIIRAVNLIDSILSIAVWAVWPAHNMRETNPKLPFIYRMNTSLSPDQQM